MRNLMHGAFGHRTSVLGIPEKGRRKAELRVLTWFLLALLVLAWWSVGVAESVTHPTPPETAPESTPLNTGATTDPTTPAAPFAGPALPFGDNPDPSQCGIPQPLGPGVLGEVDGHYQGVLVAPQVYLYDSHLRQAVRGTLPTGSRVTVVLYQSNPMLDFYLVRADTPTGVLEGWVPGPFLRILTDDEASAARVN